MENIVSTLEWIVVYPNTFPELQEGSYISYYYWEKEVCNYNGVEYTFDGHTEFEFFTIKEDGRKTIPFNYPTPHLVAKVDFTQLDAAIRNFRKDSEDQNSQ